MNVGRWNGMFKYQPPKVEHLPMIRVTHVIGEGVGNDPVRQVIDYYEATGEHVCRVDPIDGAKP